MLGRIGIVVLGIVVGQLVLFAPSFLGNKVLLPLDILGEKGYYLPRKADQPAARPHNLVLSDQILVLEAWRHFTAQEYRAGRLPLWDPAIFTGTPLAFFSIYSPHDLLYIALPSPYTLVWMQLLKSLVAGCGFYYFLRCVLRVGFWPAVLGAWCYPLTGFLVLWQGYYSTAVVALLPWLLAATDRTIRRPGGWGGPVLAVLTGLVLVSGQVDVACQVLLAVGLYGLWCLADAFGLRPGFGHVKAVLAVAGGWTLGIVLAAPYLLPLAEYLQTGARMQQRFRGSEERLPIGGSALVQVLVPEFYGSTQQGSFRIIPDDNLLESSAAGYAGLLATLLAAPVAFSDPRRRWRNGFWLMLAVIGLGWAMNIPGLIWILRLPVMNMMSGNRLVFLTGFAILVLAIEGLDVIRRGEFRWRQPFLVFPILLLGLGALCTYFTFFQPEPVGQSAQYWLDRRDVHVATPFGIAGAEGLHRIQRTFALVYLTAAALAALGIAGWVILRRARRTPRWFLPVCGALFLAELLIFACDKNPQCDPALYYPSLPVLEPLHQNPGRILGVNCLQPNLCEMLGLRDIRGYDAVDPLRVLQVLRLGGNTSHSPSYARTQILEPFFSREPDQPASIPPVFHMLNVRYFLFRTRPPAGLKAIGWHQDDYWIVENHEALPRAYIPRQVQAEPDSSRMLDKLGRTDFDPGQVAYVERPLALPPMCRGQAAIGDEVPCRVTVAVRMETAGLLVLADQWHPGWNADVDGAPAAILRTNHALRGVLVPEGEHTVVFRYQPRSFAIGVQLFLGAAAILLIWVAVVVWCSWRKVGAARPGSLL